MLAISCTSATAIAVWLPASHTGLSNLHSTGLCCFSSHTATAAQTWELVGEHPDIWSAVQRCLCAVIQTVHLLHDVWSMHADISKLGYEVSLRPVILQQKTG